MVIPEIPKSSPVAPMRKSISLLEMLIKFQPRALNTMVFVLLGVAFSDNLCALSQGPKGYKAFVSGSIVEV